MESIIGSLISQGGLGLVAGFALFWVWQLTRDKERLITQHKDENERMMIRHKEESEKRSKEYSANLEAQNAKIEALLGRTLTVIESSITAIQAMTAKIDGLNSLERVIEKVDEIGKLVRHGTPGSGN